MLNSEWPIGTVGVRTLAAPQQVDGVTSAMGNLWLDRPITVAGIDIGAGQATLHVLTSYGVAQDIQLRTNTDGLVDRFEVSLQRPVIKSWHDIDAELTKSGARYSYQVSKVIPEGPAGKCVNGRGHEHRPFAAAGVDLQTLCAACGCRRGQGRDAEMDRSAHHHRRGEGRRIGQPRGASARRAGFGAQGGTGDDFGERQHGDRLVDRATPSRRRRACPGDRRPSRPGQHDAVPDHARAVLDRLGSTGPARAVAAAPLHRAARSSWSKRIPARFNRIRRARALRRRATAPNGTAARPISAGCTPHFRPPRSARRHR